MNNFFRELKPSLEEHRGIYPGNTEIQLNLFTDYGLDLVSCNNAIMRDFYIKH